MKNTEVHKFMDLLVFLNERNLAYAFTINDNIYLNSTDIADIAYDEEKENVINIKVKSRTMAGITEDKEYKILPAAIFKISFSRLDIK